MSYVYSHARVVQVIDGDTVKLALDLGNKITWTDNFRLNGIDTPEKGQLGHDAATSRLNALLQEGITLAETFRPDKYGRWLVDLYAKVDGNERLVNQVLREEGHAKEYHGGAKT